MVGKSKNIIPLFFIIGFYGVAIFINKDLIRPKIEISKQDSALNFNTHFLKFVSMGNRRFFADIIWVQTLLASDEVHYKKNDLNSWMYIRFNNVAELDPLFYQNYLWGGIYLSIVKDDRLGAAEIFEKGLKYYPNDYDLNYNAGFNYYAQLNNYKRAHELFSRIENNPKAPRFLITLNARIKFQDNFDFDGTMAFLLDHYNKSNDEMLKRKIKDSLYSLKAERDLNCLNSNTQEKNCDRKDLNGINYQMKNGQYITEKPFTPYRIHKNQ
ncbi:MAG: tetratricopeptide repeat protein [Bacteriovoracaceae bacterium]